MKKIIKKGCICIIAITAVIMFTSCTNGNIDMERYPMGTLEPSQIEVPYNPRTLANDEIYTIADIVKMVEASVVGISVMYDETNDATGSLGSGVVIDENGYIVTNHHVVSEVGMIQAVFFDGTKVDCNLLWSDSNLDLAVLKAEGQFPSMAMGTSEEIDVGDTVIAIGTPLTMKFQHTVTAGIVSAKNRTLTIPSDDGISFMEDLLQTDASINPGNSGGPLINMQGQLVGINTLKVAEAEGLGFAIPIDIVKPIVENVISNPDYKTPYLGIMAMDKEIASYLGKELESGVMVMEIDNTSPAFRAGLRQGAIITAINNVPINSVFDLRKNIYSIGAEIAIDITYVLDGQEYTSSAVLESR